MDPEDMSDAQMHQLLKDAEHRLRHGTELNATADHPEKSSRSNVLLSTDLTNGLPSPCIKTNKAGTHVDPSLLVTADERRLANGPRIVHNPIASKNKTIQDQKASAGADWFNLPRTVLTPELKRDLQLLRMRSVLDPKRHYKKDNKRKNDVPEFSQVGTIIEGPTEFLTARLTNKERKRTLVEEVLSGEKSTHRFKSKYNEIQTAKTSGKKAHYKALKIQRAQKSSKG